MFSIDGKNSISKPSISYTIIGNQYYLKYSVAGQSGKLPFPSIISKSFVESFCEYFNLMEFLTFEDFIRSYEEFIQIMESEKNHSEYFWLSPHKIRVGVFSILEEVGDSVVAVIPEEYSRYFKGLPQRDFSRIEAVNGGVVLIRKRVDATLQ